MCAMTNRIFGSEQDVRRWAWGNLMGEKWWIENKSGGSFGFTDLVIAHDGVSGMIELKLGEWSTEKSGFGIKFSIRAAQLGTLRALARERVPSGVLVGIAGTDGAAFVRVDDIEVIERKTKGVRRTVRKVLPVAARRWVMVDAGSDILRIARADDIVAPTRKQ